MSESPVSIKEIVQEVFRVMTDRASGDRMSPASEYFKHTGALVGAAGLVVIAGQERARLTCALVLDYLGAFDEDESERPACVWFSARVPRNRLAVDLLSVLSGIAAPKLAAGHLSKDDWVTITQTSARLSRTKLLVNDELRPGLSRLPDLCDIEENVGLVVLDGLERFGGVENAALLEEILEKLRGRDVSVFCVVRDAVQERDPRELQHCRAAVEAADLLLFAGPGEEVTTVVPGLGIGRSFRVAIGGGEVKVTPPS